MTVAAVFGFCRPCNHLGNLLVQEADFSGAHKMYEKPLALQSGLQ